MKTREIGADTAQRQPAAALGKQATVQAARGEVAIRLNAQQLDVDQSPRLLAQRRAHDAAFGGAIQCQSDALDDEEPVQARAAPDNETGMPDQLKAGIETLSSMDMSDVRVHRNSDKPAQLNALAYAQGNDIHLGPGQERHLPHEAWHVVQQRQGRVRETTRAAGRAINDEAGLETEADRMGARLSSSLQRKPTPAAEPEAPAGGTPVQRAVVQCKMGFEFETGRNLFIKNPTTNKQFDRKDVAYDNGRCRLEGDSGFHLEFVTEPYDNWPQLQQAIQEAKAVADDLEQRARSAPYGQIVVGTGDGFTEDHISMRIRDLGFSASVQSTEGVALGALSGMIQEHLQGSVATAIDQKATAAIADARQRGNIAAQAQILPSVQGMVLALVMYVHHAQAHKGTSTDGPKAGFRLMARTDFRSMFGSLTDQEKMQLKLILYGQGSAANADGQNNPITQATGVQLDALLFGHGYMDEGTLPPQRNVAGPTLRGWLSSITNAAPGRDLLSPPDGYTAHRDLLGPDAKFRYGMGAMGMDNGLALFEMRGYRSLVGKKTKAEWESFAQAKYDLAAVRNTSLQPRVPAQPAAPTHAQQGVAQQGAAQQQAPVLAPQPLAPQPVPQQHVQNLQQQVLAQLPQLPAQPVQQPIVPAQVPFGGYNLRPRKRP